MQCLCATDLALDAVTSGYMLHSGLLSGEATWHDLYLLHGHSAAGMPILMCGKIQLLPTGETFDAALEGRSCILMGLSESHAPVLHWHVAYGFALGCMVMLVPETLLAGAAHIL